MNRVDCDVSHWTRYGFWFSKLFGEVLVLIGRDGLLRDVSDVGVKVKVAKLAAAGLVMYGPAGPCVSTSTTTNSQIGGPSSDHDVLRVPTDTHELHMRWESKDRGSE